MLITNGVTGYYIYDHMKPITSVSTNTKTEYIPSQFFYRVNLRDGGEIKAARIVDKGNDVDLFEDGRMTITIAKDNIYKIEKVYYNSSKEYKKTTTKINAKKYN